MILLKATSLLTYVCVITCGALDTITSHHYKLHNGFLALWVYGRNIPYFWVVSMGFGGSFLCNFQEAPHWIWSKIANVTLLYEGLQTSYIYPHL